MVKGEFIMKNCCSRTFRNIDQIESITEDTDPLKFIEDLLPFKKLDNSQIFRKLIWAMIFVYMLFHVPYILKHFDKFKCRRFIMRHSIYCIGPVAILVIVQFLRWRKTVVKFPSEVRKMSLNLKCAGTKVYNRILKECKIIKMLCYLNLAMSMIASASLTPFIGDESKFFILITILDEYFPNYTNSLKYLCVPILFCFGYTLTVPLLFCTHYVSHLKFQFTILNEFLKQMNEGEISDQNYQEMIFLKLKLCIQLHNNIKKAYKEVMTINNPLGILMVLVSTLVFVPAAYFILTGISPQSNFRMYFILISWCFIASTFCTTAQSLSNESEKVFINAYNCPWIYWNKNNRRALMMIMSNSLNPMEAKIYITETNHVLLVKLWRLAYATLTCLANIH